MIEVCTQDSEKWEVVFGYEGLYKISSLGNVLSTKKQALLKTSFNSDGYPQVSLCKNSKSKTFTIHRLMAKSFFGIYGRELEVNHKDGDKKNCNLNNLELVSREYNMKHAKDNNLLNPRKGEKNGRAKLSEDDVLYIRQLLKIKTPQREIARIFNISCQSVSSINVGNGWTHI